MKSGQFEKALKLMKKTGMGMVIMDEGGDRAFILMNIDDFQAELGVSHDMGTMDAVQSEEATQEDGETKDIWDVMPEAGDAAETWDPDGLSAEEKVDLERQYEDFAAKNVSEAVGETAKPAPEPEAPKTQKKEEDFGEEEFYLEPVD